MINSICSFYYFSVGIAGIEQIPATVVYLTTCGRFFCRFHFLCSKGVKLVQGAASSDTRSMALLLKNQPMDFINYQVQEGDQTIACEVGDTALIIACRRCDLDGLHILLSRGADCNMLNEKGESALHVAIESDDIECIKLLLIQRFIRINQQNYLGNTPLILACKNNNVVAVEWLLEGGADQYITNYVGYNSFKEAVLHGHTDCLGVLLRQAYSYNFVFAHWYTAFNKICDTIAPRQGLRKELNYVPYTLFTDCCAFTLGLAVRHLAGYKIE